MMKILILGGTGAMGEELVPLLAKNPDNLLCVTSRKKQSSHGNICYIKGNAMELDFITEILKKDSYDIIVDFMLYSAEEFAARYELFLKSCKQYLFFSSARVYAPSSEKINEDSARLLDVSIDKEYLADGEYSLVKAEEENILTEAIQRNWVIIRPYKTYNKNRLQLGVMEKEDWIFRAIAGKTVITLGDITNLHTSLTSASDTAKILERIIGNISLNGQTIQIANPENITWGDVIKIYSDCIEKNCGHKMKTYALADTSDIELLLGNRYRIKYDGLISRLFDDRKVREIMGEEFVWSSTKEELTRCVQEYLRKIGNKRMIRSYQIEGAYDRIVGEVEPLKSMCGLKTMSNYLLYRIFSVSTIHKVKTMINKK